MEVQDKDANKSSQSIVTDMHVNNTPLGIISLENKRIHFCYLFENIFLLSGYSVEEDRIILLYSKFLKLLTIESRIHRCTSQTEINPQCFRVTKSMTVILTIPKNVEIRVRCLR